MDGGKRQTFYVTHSMNSVKNKNKLRNSLPTFGAVGNKHKKTHSLGFDKQNIFDTTETTKVKEDPYMTLN